MVASNKQLLVEVHALQARDQAASPELLLPLPPNLSLQVKKKKGNTRKQDLTGAEALEC